MTTIAWDGFTLAGDRMCNDGGLPLTVCKIRKINDNLVGISGTAGGAAEIFEWFKNGAIPSQLPACQTSKDDWCAVLEIRPDQTIWRYSLGPIPYQIYDTTNAIGSGRDFAMAAMHLGCTAKQAIEVATELDIHTGNGIDTLTFE